MITNIDRRDFVAEFYPDPMEFLSAVIAWIKQHVEPDDVFDDSKLEAWAEANGYIHKDDLDE